MPKIIENLKEQITKEAEKQLFENGYAKTTIRSVAKGCGIAVGTMYNYFDSKDLLISAIVLRDWRECTDRMKKLDPSDRRAFLEGIYGQLCSFTAKYAFLFRDGEAAKVYAGMFDQRHKQLRRVIGDIILPICSDKNCSDPVLFAEHAAETMLFGATEGRTFDKLNLIFEKLFSDKEETNI